MILHHRALSPLRAPAEATARVHEFRRNLHEQHAARPSLQDLEGLLERCERDLQHDEGIHERREHNLQHHEDLPEERVVPEQQRGFQEQNQDIRKRLQGGHGQQQHGIREQQRRLPRRDVHEALRMLQSVHEDILLERRLWDGDLLQIHGGTRRRWLEGR